MYIYAMNRWNHELPKGSEIMCCGYVHKGGIKMMLFQFEQLRSNMKLRDEYNKVKFLLSDQSLQLLPEYQQRIQVN